MKRALIFLLIFWVILISAQPKNDEFHTLANSFVNEYRKLNIPPLQLSYVDNLNAIPSKNERIKQTTFFQNYEKSLRNIQVNYLSEEEQITHAILSYETQLNLERLALEKKWKSNHYKTNGRRLYNEPMGKEWYSYYLKKWVDEDLTPDFAYQFGLEEIKNVKKKMSFIREGMQMDEVAFQKQLLNRTYFLTNNSDIQALYDELRVTVRERAKRYFPDIEKISPVYIEKGINEDMAIAPAYYSDDTFYYNFFDKPYDKRDMGWIFLHEAIPGHHYQSQLNLQNQSVRDLFWYSGNAEGWAAYIEQFGRELGAYTEPMDAYGQLQWDLIRSVRVVLDVMLNYNGWSDEQALNFWKEHIPNKEDIGNREIKRMKRWPAQVITYKYGKYILDDLKGERKSPEELKEFHTQVLEYGSIPLSVMKKFLEIKQTEQEKNQEKYNIKLSTINGVINSLYGVISGPKEQEGDWNFLRYMFHPEAKFIFSGKSKDGSFRFRYVSMDDYIKSSEKYMLENGFFEKELHRVTEQFGQIAHVFTSYECFHTKEDEVPFMRGINSVQLMLAGKKWQVMSIYFTQETEDNPIPEKYLGN